MTELLATIEKFNLDSNINLEFDEIIFDYIEEDLNG